MDLDAASRYVRAHGGPVEIARLDRLLTGVGPATDLAEQAVADCLPGGGWPAYWSGGAASVDVTCLRLSALADLGLLASAAARRAVRWLVSCQLPDGRWQEDPGTAYSAPVWARPCDPTASWYLTANAGLCVALAAGDGPPPDSAVRAANALAAEVSEAGTLPSYLVTHWLAAGLCWRTGRKGTADRLLSRLDAADPRMTAADWSWCGWTLAVAGVPVAHPARTVACQALADRQEPDGGWADDEDGAQSVTVTLAALVALRVGVPTAG